MKPVFSVIFILLYASLSFARINPDDGWQFSAEEEASANSNFSRNIVKINATSLVFKNFSLQYERLLTQKMSVALGFRWMPKTGLPFKGSIESLINQEENKEEIEHFLDNTRMSGIAITPEFRYYLGKGNGQGFYVAPFLRYEQFNIQSVYPFESSKDIDFKGNYKSMGVGIMIGSQFRISDAVSLDWWIIGPYYTAPRFHLSAAIQQLSPEEQEELKYDLGNITIDIGNYKVQATVDDGKAEIKSSGNLAAIRGLGLCLGIKF